VPLPSATYTARCDEDSERETKRNRAGDEGGTSASDSNHEGVEHTRGMSQEGKHRRQGHNPQNTILKKS
jgi:hypothetical protein